MLRLRNQSIKTLILLVMTMAMSSVMFGQKDDDDGKGGKPGLLLGVNLANVDGVDATNKTGFYGGVLWEQKLVPILRLQSGLVYVQNGFKTETAGIESLTKLNYLQVPVIAKVKILAFYGLAGFTGGYRVAASNVTNDVKVKIESDQLNRFDFGAQVGLGFKILFFGIEGRYNWGLSNISKADGVDYNNRYFQLGVHFML
jgi:hypothetical protein